MLVQIYLIFYISQKKLDVYILKFTVCQIYNIKKKLIFMYKNLLIKNLLTVNFLVFFHKIL